MERSASWCEFKGPEKSSLDCVWEYFTLEFSRLIEFTRGC